MCRLTLLSCAASGGFRARREPSGGGWTGPLADVTASDCHWTDEYRGAKRKFAGWATMRGTEARSEATPRMLSTIALFASSRRHGNTGAVLNKIAAELRFGVVDLCECNVTPYDYAHANRADGFEPLICKILEHEQIVFAAPVYWYSVPPQMKTFIDRLTDLLELPDLREKGRQLRGKRAFVVATSGVDAIAPAFISMFRDTFAYLGIQYCGHLHVNCDGGYKDGTGERDIKAFESLLRGQ